MQKKTSMESAICRDGGRVSNRFELARYLRIEVQPSRLSARWQEQPISRSEIESLENRLKMVKGEETAKRRGGGRVPNSAWASREKHLKFSYLAFRQVGRHFLPFHLSSEMGGAIACSFSELRRHRRRRARDLVLRPRCYHNRTHYYSGPDDTLEGEGRTSQS